MVRHGQRGRLTRGVGVVANGLRALVSAPGALQHDGAVDATKGARPVGDDDAPVPPQQIAEAPVDVRADAARQAVEQAAAPPRPGPVGQQFVEDDEPTTGPHDAGGLAEARHPIGRDTHNEREQPQIADASAQRQGLDVPTDYRLAETGGACGWEKETGTLPLEGNRRRRSLDGLPVV